MVTSTFMDQYKVFLCIVYLLCIVWLDVYFVVSIYIHTKCVCVFQVKTIVCLRLCVLCIMLWCIVYCVTWCVPAVIWEGGLSSAGSRSGPEIVVIQLNFHNNWNGSQVIVIRNSKWNNWNRSAVIAVVIILIFVTIYSTQIEKIMSMQCSSFKGAL